MPFLLKYWKYIAVVGIVLGGLGWAAYQGHISTKNKYEAKIAKMQLELEQKRNEMLLLQKQLGAEQEKHTSAMDALNLERQRKNKVITETITEEVIKYVQVESDHPDCELPAGFVRIHNAAATGVPTPADTAGEPDAGAGGFTDVDLLPVVVSNYGTCRGFREQLLTWQAWAKGLQND